MIKETSGERSNNSQEAQARFPSKRLEYLSAQAPYLMFDTSNDTVCYANAGYVKHGPPLARYFSDPALTRATSGTQDRLD